MTLVKIGNNAYVNKAEIVLFCSLDHISENTQRAATDLTQGGKSRSALLLNNGTWLLSDISINTLRTRIAGE